MKFGFNTRVEFDDDCMYEKPGTLGARKLLVGRRRVEVHLVELERMPRFVFDDGADATLFVAAAVSGSPVRVWASVAAHFDGASLSPEAAAWCRRTGVELPDHPWRASFLKDRWYGRLAGAAGWNCWTLVLLDETEHWCAEVRALVDKVFGMYAYDALSVTHMCEATPSYVLHPLGHVATGLRVDEEQIEKLDEMLRQGDDGELVTVHCHDIDRLPAARRRALGFLPAEVEHDPREYLGDAGENEHVFAWKHSADGRCWLDDKEDGNGQAEKEGAARPAG